MGFIFNVNTFLIEQYKIFVFKKHGAIPTQEEVMKDTLLTRDFLFILNYSDGLLIKEDCLLEFYFLLMVNEYDLAITLLSKPYSEKLRESLNHIFLDDDTNALSSILFSEDIVKGVVHSAIERELDGVAL